MEKYEFLSRTGEGAYGSVWRARDKNNGLMVAVKKMKEVPTTEEEGEIAMREVRVLQCAKHVGIVNLLEAYKSQSGRLYLVFEYVERTLLQELKANRGGMPPAVVKSITWQLLQALSYLHRKQIIHRDIKPSNILLTEGGVVKICDFGFARACVNSTSDPAYTTYVVTRWYRPPEVLVGDTYGPPVDVWALGCIFAEMLAGRPLFPGRNHHDQLWLILKCLGTMTERQLELLDSDPQFACFRLPTLSELEPLEHRLGNIPAPAMQLLRACLNPDPKQRASADELLAMPYFHGVTEVLPLEELLAYPDSDMRAKLEHAIAQDQAAAAQAVPFLNGKRPLAPANKQHHVAPATSGPVSPTRLAPQPSVPPLPAKAVTVPKMEPCAEAQRPPLLRHITAPPGGMACKVQLQPPLHPVPELPPQHPQHHHHQRTRSSSDGSQQGSPQPPLHAGSGLHLGALARPRGRSWQASGDGSGDNTIGPFVRQLSGTGNVPSQQHPHVATAPGIGASDHSVFGGRSQRNTWNGTTGHEGPRRVSLCGGGAASGGIQGAHSTQGGHTSSLNSSLTNSSHAGANTVSTQANDPVAVYRKAHSLAGNEALQIAGGLAPSVRGPGGLGVVQGRSLAPPSATATGGGVNGASGNAGLQLPPSQFGFPAASSIQRLTPSPPPQMYGGSLRSTNSMPVAALSVLPGRASSDGTHGQQAHPAAFCGKPPPGPGAAGLHVSGPIPTAALDETSDGSEPDTSADQNDGRRASDTVLYAAAALKEAKNRLDKASHIISATSRQQSGGLDGSSNSSTASSGPPQGLAVPRVPSFGRSSGNMPTGPPSPDLVPSSLPPLHHTPRRMSAPEPSLTAPIHPSALLPSAASANGGGRQAAGAVPQAPVAGSGYLQRHNMKQGQHPHPPHGQGMTNGSHTQQPSVADIEGPEGASTAHVSLPALDVGPGKGRLPSGAVVGVGVARRPSKGSIRLAADGAQCKREEPAALEAVPE